MVNAVTGVFQTFIKVLKFGPEAEVSRDIHAVTVALLEDTAGYAQLLILINCNTGLCRRPWPG